MSQKDSQVSIEVSNISKTFVVKQNSIQSIRDYAFNILKKRKENQIISALSGVNFNILTGETVGIIGRNGSGKSTLLNIIMGSIRADKGGIIKTHGRIIRLALGMGIDLNLTARDNIYLNGSIIGLSFKKIGTIFSDIIEFAGLEDFVDTPVKFYSKGMKARLNFSIAMHAEADVILLDEFFGGVGDQDFKKKSDEMFKQKILEGKTIIIVSHSMSIIQKYCTRCIYIDKGKIIIDSHPKEVVQLYLNSFEN